MVFSPLDGYSGPGMKAEVACGRCIGCLERRKRDWAVRMMHEAQGHKLNSFITLTYDPEHLPLDGSLNVKHWQKFAKRLRMQKGPFRFYHCGEYGPLTQRPHYHACLFGMAFEDQVETGASKSGQPMFGSADLMEIWKCGIATVQAFSMETAAYVAGYAVKKDFSKKSLERLDPLTGECWDVKPEYATMSRRPGIGAEWLKRFKSDVYPHDYVVTAAGTKVSPPRYYDSFLSEAESLEVKDLRRRRSWKRASDETPERRLTREAVAKSKYDFFHGTRM